MNTIRMWLLGRKAYLTGAGMIIAALAGWAQGTLTQTDLILAIFAALGIIFIRSGVTTEIQKLVNK